MLNCESGVLLDVAKDLIVFVDIASEWNITQLVKVSRALWKSINANYGFGLYSIDLVVFRSLKGGQ